MKRKLVVQRSDRAVRAATAVAVALAGNLMIAAPAAAADVTPPELVDVMLSTSAVSVAGLGYKVVVVSVHLTDDTGVVPSGDFFDLPGPGVSLSRVAPRGDDFRVLTLASGTPTDGVWTARMLVPSTYHGLWRVSRINAMDAAENSLHVDPASIGIVRTLQVIGTHRPRLTLRFVPRPATVRQTVTAMGRLTYTDTGRPIPGRVLFFGFASFFPDEDPCGTGEDRVTTDRNGYYRFEVPSFVLSWTFRTCVHLIAPVPSASSFDPLSVAHIASRSGLPVLRALVNAVPARRVAPLGGRIRIDGNVRPNPFGARVLLRRWTRNGWITEATAIIRDSGRYTIYARPPARGTFRYRVHKPSRLPGLVSGASPTMFLTAT